MPDGVKPKPKLKPVAMTGEGSLKTALKKEIKMHKDAKHSIANTAFFKEVEKLVSK